MTLFFLGVAVGILAGLTVLFLIVAFDRRWHPECSECASPMATGNDHGLCPRCQELAAMAEGKQP